MSNKEPQNHEVNPPQSAATCPLEGLYFDIRSSWFDILRFQQRPTSISNRTKAVLPRKSTKIANMIQIHGCFVFVIFAFFYGNPLTTFFKLNPEPLTLNPSTTRLA